MLCKYCTFGTENIDELDNHVLSHEENSEGNKEDFQDVIMFAHNNEKPKRKQRKREPDSYRCPNCNYETKRKYDLPKHLLTHSTLETTTVYKCSQCPYETKRKNDMPKHMLAHCTNVQMFKCPECPYQTKRKSDLPKHLICHMPCEELPLYQCGYCDYVTKRKGDLPKHLLNHKDTRNLEFFDCSECHYKTKRKNDLHKHMLVHCDRQVAGVFKCRKCVYATDKINKFSKHVLSGCISSDNPIDVEQLMLEDIIGVVNEEDIMTVRLEEEEDDVEEYEEQLSDYVEQDENVDTDEQTEQPVEETPADSFTENEFESYKWKDEISKTKYKEAVMKKHGVFKINLGEFSYGNLTQNQEPGSEEYSIEAVS